MEEEQTPLSQLSKEELTLLKRIQEEETSKVREFLLLTEKIQKLEERASELRKKASQMKKESFLIQRIVGEIRKESKKKLLSKISREEASSSSSAPAGFISSKQLQISGPKTRRTARLEASLARAKKRRRSGKESEEEEEKVEE
jgi:hypothetical protein